MATKVRPGENLQRLVRAIEQATNSAPNVTVESPKRMRDKDTGKLREHDVVLTFSFNHHSMIVAIECRDRSRKIGVPEVEAFRAKCDRTGIHRGIMVSSLGFRKTALKKAAEMEIGCLGLEETVRFNWCLAPGVETYQRDLLPGPSWEIATAAPFVGPPQLYGPDGNPLTLAGFSAIAQDCLKQRPPDIAKQQDDEARTNPVLCDFVNSAASQFFLIDQSGSQIPLTRMVIHVRYQVRHTLTPFSFHDYIDYAKGNSLYKTAIAHVDLDNLKGDLVMHQEATGEVTVSFVPRQG